MGVALPVSFLKHTVMVHLLPAAHWPGILPMGLQETPHGNGWVPCGRLMLVLISDQDPDQVVLPVHCTVAHKLVFKRTLRLNMHRFHFLLFCLITRHRLQEKHSISLVLNSVHFTRILET